MRNKKRIRIGAILLSFLLSSILLFGMGGTAFAETKTYSYSENSTESKEEDKSSQEEGETEEPGGYIPPSEDSKYRDYDFVIDAYDVQIHVNEDNTLDITEKLNCWFNQPKHGVMRTLPRWNHVVRQDGSTSDNQMKVTDVSCSDPFDLSKDEVSYSIKIGESDKTFSGRKDYTISYKCNLGEDPLADKDEFYYNLIGAEWTVPIGNVTFTIEMPKAFDKETMGFSAGWSMTADDSGIDWQVDSSGLTITGSYDSTLEAGQALTVRMELPEGYFVGAGFGEELRDWIMYGVPVFFLLVAFLLWLRFGKDDKAPETVEYYPPDDLNSLETAFLYKGTCNDKDVTSLLIYLANKGYIAIEDTDKLPSFYSRKNFQIAKIRDYDGTNEEEKMFMQGLFGNRQPVDGKVTVTSGMLYNRFYVTTNAILKRMRDKSHVDKVFEKNSGWKNTMIIVMLIISEVLICLPPVLEFAHPLMIAPAVVPGIAFSAVFALAFLKKGKGYSKDKGKAINWKDKATMFLTGLALALMVAWYPGEAFLPVLIEKSFYFWGYIFGILCIFGMILCIIYMPRRTPYGVKMLGRINSFRDFLMGADKAKLEELLALDPQYFYTILPYASVLGVSEVWNSDFEGLQAEAPGWYVGEYTDTVSFGYFVECTMRTTQRAMSSSPSSSSYSSSRSYSGSSFSSSSYSGGGFSGGGSGGGGGSSW